MQVMEELGLIGLRIQRMPSEPGLEFGIPSQYNYMTVRLSNITFICTLPRSLDIEVCIGDLVFSLCSLILY